MYMKTISSAEFRKTYARLTEETVVTALGRTIGTWIPGPVELGSEKVPEQEKLRIAALVPRKVEKAITAQAEIVLPGTGPVGTGTPIQERPFREFRPVPKPAGKKK